MCELSEEQVKEIISLSGKMYQKDIAKMYGLSQQYVSEIINYKKWAHLEVEKKAIFNKAVQECIDVVTKDWLYHDGLSLMIEALENLKKR